MNVDRDALANYRRLTLAMLLVGYGGYYVCRSNLSVATPLILKEFAGQGIDKQAIGLVASISVGVYLAGKFLNGIASDIFGGRRMFLLGMLGSVAATIAFGLGSGLAVFVIAASCNRLFQSMGWPALLKLSSRWFGAASYGTILGILSLSYLFGDAAARWFLGELIEELSFGWREVFYASAATLGTIAILEWLLLRDAPDGLVEQPKEPSAPSLQTADSTQAPQKLLVLLVPLVSSLSFWLVCVMSFGTTLIRETFNLWVPTYLTEVAGASAGTAAKASLLFPLVGGISVLLTGWLSDRFGPRWRGRLIAPPLALATLAIAALGLLGPQQNITTPLILISAVSFFFIGPYSLLGGAMALDFGGTRSGATAGGLIDGWGYVGGMVSGWGIAKLAESYGWQQAFLFLAFIAGITCLVAIVYWFFRGQENVSPEPGSTDELAVSGEVIPSVRPG